MGSTFALDLPIYSRNMDHPAAPVDTDAVVAFSPTLQPQPNLRPRKRAANPVRLLPVDDTSEGLFEHDGGVIEGVAHTLSILIVDDSSANRSG